MSCTVAMSIDYSLFLLSRYQEEVSQPVAHSHFEADMMLMVFAMTGCAAWPVA